MRLMLVLIAGLFAYLMWRIVRIMSRTGGFRQDEGLFGGPRPPVEPFSNVKDADFEELKHADKDESPETKQ